MYRACMGLAVVLSLIMGQQQAGAAEESKTRISLSGAWALYPMAVRWTEEYGKLNPKIQFDVSAGGAGKGMTDALNGAVDIGMVSRDVKKEEVDKGALPVAVTKDAVIPMVSAKNPALAQLQKQGVKKSGFTGVWVDKSVTTWGQLAGTDLKAPIHIYTRSDACGAAQTWAEYMGAKQEGLTGIGVYGDPGIGEAVRRDPLGIGYNNVNFAYDAKTGLPVEGLAVIPLDVNENGVVDEAENVYATRDTLTQAIASDRFPSPPARKLFFVTRGVPAQAEVRAFIQWVLTEGQTFVEESGYIRLPQDVLETEYKKMNAGK